MLQGPIIDALRRIRLIIFKIALAASLPPSGRMFMNKVYPDAKSALDDILRDGMMIMSGGFGLCGIAQTLPDAIRDPGGKNLTWISNNTAGDGMRLTARTYSRAAWATRDAAHGGGCRSMADGRRGHAGPTRSPGFLRQIQGRRRRAKQRVGFRHPPPAPGRAPPRRNRSRSLMAWTRE